MSSYTLESFVTPFDASAGFKSKMTLGEYAQLDGNERLQVVYSALSGGKNDNMGNIIRMLFEKCKELGKKEASAAEMQNFLMQQTGFETKELNPKTVFSKTVPRPEAAYMVNYLRQFYNAVKRGSIDHHQKLHLLSFFNGSGVGKTFTALFLLEFVQAHLSGLPEDQLDNELRELLKLVEENHVITVYMREFNGMKSEHITSQEDLYLHMQYMLAVQTLLPPPNQQHHYQVLKNMDNKCKAFAPVGFDFHSKEYVDLVHNAHSIPEHKGIIIKFVQDELQAKTKKEEIYKGLKYTPLFNLIIASGELVSALKADMRQHGLVLAIPVMVGNFPLHIFKLLDNTQFTFENIHLTGISYQDILPFAQESVPRYSTILTGRVREIFEAMSCVFGGVFRLWEVVVTKLNDRETRKPDDYQNGIQMVSFRRVHLPHRALVEPYQRLQVKLL